jgi:hypothetical protein
MGVGFRRFGIVERIGILRLRWDARFARVPASLRMTGLGLKLKPVSSWMSYAALKRRSSTVLHAFVLRRGHGRGGCFRLRWDWLRLGVQRSFASLRMTKLGWGDRVGEMVVLTNET